MQHKSKKGNKRKSKRRRSKMLLKTSGRRENLKSRRPRGFRKRSRGRLGTAAQLSFTRHKLKHSLSNQWSKSLRKDLRN